MKKGEEELEYVKMKMLKWTTRNTVLWFFEKVKNTKSYEILGLNLRLTKNEKCHDVFFLDQ